VYLLILVILFIPYTASAQITDIFNRDADILLVDDYAQISYLIQSFFAENTGQVGNVTFYIANSNLSTTTHSIVDLGFAEGFALEFPEPSHCKKRFYSDELAVGYNTISFADTDCVLEQGQLYSFQTDFAGFFNLEGANANLAQFLEVTYTSGDSIIPDLIIENASSTEAQNSGDLVALIGLMTFFSGVTFFGITTNIFKFV